MTAKSTTCNQCSSPLDLRGLCPRCVAMEFFTPPGALATQEVASFRHGGMIGSYTILDEVARGGMGVVYRARQAGLERVVALKTVLVSSRAEPSFQARFRAEAAAAASLNHPGIVSVHEIGEVDGCLYFSMDFIEGQTLAELAATNPLPAREAAALLRQAAEAIDYAHAKGVVHRDLKPSNMIRDSSGRVRITDFGLAKILNAPEDFTLPGHPIGTPAYMAPEQISANPAQPPINARSVDIYSLGATLYHLLAGRPPFVGPSISSVLAQVANASPVPPRDLNPAVPRDLETICQKCLSKAPERRYATAAELVQDLQRFLEGRRIRARRASLAEQAWTWSRRNPGLATSLGTVMSLLVAVALMSRISSRHIAALHGETLTNLYSADMLLVSEAVSANRFGFALELLERHVPRNGIPDLRGPEWYFLHRQSADDQAVTLGRHEAQAQRVAFSKDGRYAASAASDLRVWDVQAHTLIVRQQFEDFVSGLAFSPDANRLVVAIRTGQVHCFELPKGNEVAGLTNVTASAYGLRWLSDGRGIVLVSGAQLLRWRPGNSVENTPLDLRRGVARTAISAAGDVAAVTVPDWKLRLFPPAAARPSVEISLDGPVRAVALATDATRVVAGNFAGNLSCFSTSKDGKLLRRFKAHRGLVECAAFSPDDRYLATGGADQVIRLWDTSNWQLAGLLRGHRTLVLSLAFSPDGALLLSGDKDGEVKLWNVKSARPPIQGEEQPAVAAIDGSELLVFNQAGRPRVIDPDRLSLADSNRSPELPSIPGGLWGISSKRLVAADSTGKLSLFQEDGTPVPSELPRHARPTLPELSPDGKLLVFFSPTNRLPAVWSIPEHRCILTVTEGPPATSRPAMDRRSTHLAVGFADGYCQVFSLTKGKALGSFAAHKAFCYACDFSPNGELLVTAGFDGLVRLWRTETQRLVREFKSSADAYWSVAFSPDGNRIAAGTGESTIVMWDAANGKEVGWLDLGEPLAPIEGQLRFNPNGSCLVLCGPNRWRVWSMK